MNPSRGVDVVFACLFAFLEQSVLVKHNGGYCVRLFSVSFRKLLLDGFLLNLVLRSGRAHVEFVGKVSFQ